jgi:L-ascorbate metabolism protein UlaG (beta-lactamase superfamily)
MKINTILPFCIAVIIIQSCTMININVSEKRIHSSQKINLEENITLTTWGAIKINKSHFFPSSFQIKTSDDVIYFDPVEINCSEFADYIFLTHAHPDHLSLKDIQKIIKPETIVVCSRSVSKKLKFLDNIIHIMKPGEDLTLKGIHVEATPAYNTKPIFLWIKAHPKNKENIGFILTLNNYLRIYHAGDTDYIPEMKQLNNIDVIFVPIGGDNLTMNSYEGALMVNEIKPKTVIPMHFEINNKDGLSLFKQQVDKNIFIIEFGP